MANTDHGVSSLNRAQKISPRQCSIGGENLFTPYRGIFHRIRFAAIHIWLALSYGL